MSRIRSMPTCPMSSRRPRNGLMYTAPAFAESRACGAEKQSVWLTRMPSPLRYFTALIPSLVSGHLTTTLGATCTSSLPSFTMPSKSVATTSRLTSPGTTLQISSTSGRKGRFSLAMSEGFVVQPSTRPMATPSRSSFTFAVSRKIFMSSSGSGELPELHHLAGILALGLHRDAEVNLVAPGLPGDAEGQGLPDRRGGLRVV